MSSSRLPPPSSTRRPPLSRPRLAFSISAAILSPSSSFSPRLLVHVLCSEPLHRPRTVYSTQYFIHSATRKGGALAAPVMITRNLFLELELAIARWPKHAQLS